jgi:PIN domain nuclease of toxin-antitoxin system
MSSPRTSRRHSVRREAPGGHACRSLECNRPATTLRIGTSCDEDGTNELSVSIVTAWEIVIKHSLGKLDLPEPAERWLPEVLRRTGFAVAEIGLAAALRVRALPWHHRDPFDRLLIAHALEDGYTGSDRV